eukprot:scaffold86803_cov69-Phaeocystis_antarctica.AAC.2
MASDWYCAHDARAPLPDDGVVGEDGAHERREDELQQREHRHGRLVGEHLQWVVGREAEGGKGGRAEGRAVGGDGDEGELGQELDDAVEGPQEALRALERVLEHAVGVLHVLGLGVDVGENHAHRREGREDERAGGHRAQVEAQHAVERAQHGEARPVGRVGQVPVGLRAGEVPVAHGAADGGVRDGLDEEEQPQPREGLEAGGGVDQRVRVDRKLVELHLERLDRAAEVVDVRVAPGEALDAVAGAAEEGVGDVAREEE